MTVPRLKVMTILGTRPEIIRLSRVMAALDRWTDHIIVHTGQNYDHELNDVFFEELKIRRPDHVLDAAGSSAAETIGEVIIAVDRVLATEKPDAVLVLGRHQQLPRGHPRKTTPHSHLPYGSRQPVLRPACS